MKRPLITTVILLFVLWVASLSIFLLFLAGLAGVPELVAAIVAQVGGAVVVGALLLFRGPANRVALVLSRCADIFNQILVGDAVFAAKGRQMHQQLFALGRGHDVPRNPRSALPCVLQVLHGIRRSFPSTVCVCSFLNLLRALDVATQRSSVILSVSVGSRRNVRLRLHHALSCFSRARRAAHRIGAQAAASFVAHLAPRRRASDFAHVKSDSTITGIQCIKVKLLTLNYVFRKHDEFDHLEYKRIGAVFVPRALEVGVVVPPAFHVAPMLREALSEVYAAANIDFSVGNASNPINARCSRGWYSGHVNLQSRLATPRMLLASRGIRIEQLYHKWRYSAIGSLI